MESGGLTVEVCSMLRPTSVDFQLNISYEVKDIHILQEDHGRETLITEDSFSQFINNISSNYDASFLKKEKHEIHREIIACLASLEIDSSPADCWHLANFITNKIIHSASRDGPFNLQPKFKIIRERRIYSSPLEFQGRRDHGMVPTDPKSLSLLLKPMEEEEAGGRESIDAKETCTICLENIVDSAMSMPCNHMFHNKCIVMWLQQSHYCPICRFEMPSYGETEA